MLLTLTSNYRYLENENNRTIPWNETDIVDVEAQPGNTCNITAVKRSMTFGASPIHSSWQV